jgi:hypothetical protein
MAGASRYFSSPNWWRWRWTVHPEVFVRWKDFIPSESGHEQWMDRTLTTSQLLIS